MPTVTRAASPAIVTPFRQINPDPGPPFAPINPFRAISQQTAFRSSATKELNLLTN